MRILAISLFAALLSNNSFASKNNDVLKDEESRLNYSVGYQIGSDFRLQNFELRPEAVLKGIQDSLSDNKALLSKDEMRKTMAELGKKVADLKKKKREMATAQNQQKQQQFLEENAIKPGVITTQSGLQYKVMKKGSSNGQNPKLTDRVQVHYRGKLTDGTEFDSSFKRGKPATFGVNQVIRGWTEALQLMQPGAKWQLVIPADLAYGSKGAGKSIPPDSTLIFEVELISIQ